MKAWKKTEHKCATMLKGVRIKRQSYNESLPDVIANGFVGEAKSMKKLPQWLLNAYEQASGYANKTKKTPLVYLKEKYKHSGYVLLKEEDFIKLLSKISNFKEIS